jgi:glycosyltransferase involved in cell wall biosynthesis
MKVLHITTNYPTPKYPILGIFVKEQIESLQKEGVECDIYYSNGKEHGKWKAHVASIRPVRKLLRQQKYDLIHCHHSISALILLLAGGAIRNKCIVSYQNDPNREPGGKWVFRLLYPFFNIIIVKNPSEYLKKKKVIYLPNGTNSDFFIPMDKKKCKEELGWEQDKHYLLFVDSNAGRRTQKRHDRFEKVIELLSQKRKDIVPFEVTKIPREKMPVYFNACDLHIITSDFEGSPNSVKECMCCNTPVVSTDVGNVREMIGDIPGCYVTNNMDARELADCVEKIIDSQTEFKGRELFLAKGYDMKKVAHKLVELYKSIIG